MQEANRESETSNGVTHILDEYMALTDGRSGCQTVAGRIERRRFGAVFSTARVRRTINVQWKRDCGAFGPLGQMQNQ